MLFRQKSTKWDKLLVSFIVLVNTEAWLFGMSFFHVWVRFLHCIFFILHFYWNVCSFVPKVNWPRMERSWTSSVRLCFVSSSPYLRGLKTARNAHFCFASVDIKSSRWKIWGVFWCVLWNCLYLSDIGFCDIVWWASSMQYNFFSYTCASSCFFSCKWWSKKFLMTSENRLFFFQIFLQYSLTFDVLLCSMQKFVFEWKYWSHLMYMLFEVSVRPWNVFLACKD